MVTVTPDRPGLGHRDFAGFLDDAAVFPPGNAPVAAAVAAHLARRDRAVGELVGPLVVAPAHLDDVRRSLDELRRPVAPLAISLVVRKPDALAAAADAVRVDGRLVLAAVELAGADVPTARAALDAAGLGAEITVWLEPGWGPQLRGATDLLGGNGFGLKLRTGGTSSDAFPDEATLAAAVTGAVARNVPFKATAGLHHAVRHTDPTTRFEHHGFANLLLAARACDDGEAAARTWLACRDATAVAEALRGLGPAGLAAARTRFVSFGTCDVDDPRHDLQTLGLLDRERSPADPQEALP